MRKCLLITAGAALMILMAAGAALADKTVRVTAGPIWNNDDAQAKCEALIEKVAQKYPGQTISWDGTWKTVVEGKESVCSFLVEE